MKKKKLNNDVIFIGQWMPEKGKLFKDLIEMGLDLKIYGQRWHKDKNYEFLSSRIKSGWVSEKMYSKLIQCSKIALSILCTVTQALCKGSLLLSVIVPDIPPLTV